MKSFTVYRMARQRDAADIVQITSKDTGISCVEVKADTMDFASTGALLFYTNGQPSRCFNKGEWVEVEVKESRIHGLA